MRKINMHGLKMDGIRETAAKTRGLDQRAKVLILYDRTLGLVEGREVWDSADLIVDDPDVIICGSAKTRKTVQEIADIVFAAVTVVEYWKER